MHFLLRPKSIINRLCDYLDRSIFSGFKSLCKYPLLCILSNDKSSCYAMRLTDFIFNRVDLDCNLRSSKLTPKRSMIIYGILSEQPN
jgi:hypothetical protein